MEWIQAVDGDSAANHVEVRGRLPEGRGAVRGVDGAAGSDFADGVRGRSECGELGADPQATWVIEDSPTGAAGGLAAGCLVVGVGASMAGQDDPRLWRVESLSDITVGSLGRDGLQDPQA